MLKKGRSNYSQNRDEQKALGQASRLRHRGRMQSRDPGFPNCEWENNLSQFFYSLIPKTTKKQKYAVGITYAWFFSLSKLARKNRKTKGGSFKLAGRTSKFYTVQCKTKQPRSALPSIKHDKNLRTHLIPCLRLVQYLLGIPAYWHSRIIRRTHRATLHYQSTPLSLQIEQLRPLNTRPFTVPARQMKRKVNKDDYTSQSILSQVLAAMNMGNSNKSLTRMGDNQMPLLLLILHTL